MLILHRNLLILIYFRFKLLEYFKLDYHMLKYKIVLAGAKGIGKSSLIARYCDNVFNEHSKETIGVAFKRKEINVKRKNIEYSSLLTLMVLPLLYYCTILQTKSL